MNCIDCGHKVSRGNKHAKGQCPPPKGVRSGRRYEKAQSAKRARKKAARQAVAQKGVAVPGTGKPSASSKG